MTAFPKSKMTTLTLTTMTTGRGGRFRAPS